MPSAESILNAHHVKPTPQRVVITDFLLHTDSHPTAEEVLEAVETKLPVKLSRATVYNTLNTLVEAGVVREVSTEPGKTRYDANIREHHHFVDTRTGKIHDIPWEKVSELCESLGEDFKIQDYQITFRGECLKNPQ